MPITPNLLADSYQFSTLCGGKVNTPMHIFDAHTDSLFSTWLYNGTEGSGTVEILTLDKISEHGFGFGGDLHLATNYKEGGERNYYGSRFRVLLLDVVISKGQNNGKNGLFLVLNQGCPYQSGWNKGKVKTESQVFINVLTQKGDIIFSPHSNMPAIVSVGADDVGKGWQFKHSTKMGFGGCHQPAFLGKGSMKVAIALPYVGTGDHGGNFFWADAIKSPEEAQMNNFRYTHQMGV
jgi:hypothetical protein